MSDIALELAQLLCTRLCHDLAGPVGAVAAGVELIGDDPAAADPETLGLIGSSSAAASRKLKFLRTALGSAGGGAADLKILLEGYLEAVAGPGGKAEVQWPAPAVVSTAAASFGPAWTQTVLNLCLLALELQPGCRGLSLQCSPSRVSIEAVGRATTVREELRTAAMSNTGTPLSAKNIQAHIAGRLVRASGGILELSSAGDRIIVTATVPTAGGT